MFFSTVPFRLRRNRLAGRNMRDDDSSSKKWRFLIAGVFHIQLVRRYALDASSASRRLFPVVQADSHRAFALVCARTPQLLLPSCASANAMYLAARQSQFGRCPHSMSHRSSSSRASPRLANSSRPKPRALQCQTAHVQFRVGGNFSCRGPVTALPVRGAYGELGRRCPCHARTHRSLMPLLAT